MSEISVSVRIGQFFEWDLGQVPCRHEEPGNKVEGIFMMLCSSFWGGILTFGFITSIIVEGNSVPSMLIPLIFIVIGTGGIFLSGLNQFFTRTVTEFDGERFRYRHKSLLRSKAWDTPLSEYEGVLSRSEYHSGGRNRSSYILYIIELMHPDKQRRTTLWQSRSLSDHRASWKKYCRQLGLPALRQDGDGYTRRDVEDLDKSVRELAIEGKLDITFDPAVAVPDELELNVQGDQLEVVLNPKIPFGSIPFGSILIVFGTLALVVWLTIRYGEGLVVLVGYGFAILGIFLGILMALGISISLFGGISLVRISREGLHILTRTSRGEMPGNRIPADAIKDVRVGKAKPSQSSPAVVVETDASSHAIGHGLDKETLEWLKNCILSKIVDG